MNQVNNKLSEKDSNISDEIEDTCLQSQNQTAKEHRIMEKRENDNSETNHNDNKEHLKDNIEKDVSLACPQDDHVDEQKNDNSIKNDLVKYDEAANFEEVIPEEYTGEIIVPDITQPEDLTDDTKEDYDFVNEEEDEMTKDSDVEETEVNTSIHEESTKSSDFGVIYENESKSDKSSFNEELRDENSKDSENCDLDNMPVESELVAIEDGMKETLTCSLDDSTNDEQALNSNSNRNTADDPLNCIEIRDYDEEKFDKQTNTPQLSLESNSNDKYIEDDEVQFIETRNSPICIESDEDDTVENSKSSGNGAQIITPANSTVIVAKNVTVTRTSARKSTAKPQQQTQKRTIVNKSPSTVPHIQSKSKNFSYLQTATNHRRFTSIASTQQIVDCIDLLDSSDEECTPSFYRSPQQQQQQQTKTPQKRTLLAAKGNYYKSCSKNSTSNSNCVPNNFSYNVKQQVKKPAPPPLPPPTPQSNFLNAVQLQPAVASGINPPAFSALLLNKNVIIPNAFYGNPPSIRATPDTDLDRRYARWLENFLNQFCKPQFLPTHSCYVFLQRALKYKDFIRIKTLRSNMNIHDQRDQINNQLMTDLRTILLKNTKRVTNYGRRFCELTCSSVQGKALTLMANSITGKVTLKTCNMDIPKASATLSIATSSSSCSTNALTRKRQVDEDEDEYTPDKSKPKSKAKTPTENNDRDSGEIGEDRKRTLRTKRTKRLDNSFSYNEDDLLAEYEIDDEEEAEKLAQAEIQRKIEQKRMEAQKQRQQQVKSFESAFIQAFAKSIDGPISSVTAKNFANQGVRLKNNTPSTSSSIRQYAAINNDAEDHLKATWIENVENEDTQIISDDDEPKEHRIYKQQQVIQFQNQQNYQTSSKSSSRLNINSSLKFNKFPKRLQEDIITNEDQNYNENNNSSVPLYWPKNVDPQMYVNGKHKDRCIICNLSCQRLVHHYVNEHRGCEVYNSRLSSLQLQLLKQGNYIFSNVSLYKNGQYQYEAYCIFCEKQSRFMLPYWYQHFTMHTGEYAYRCTGCGVRKPTRSLLTQHHAQGCPEDGNVAQDYAHDSKTMQIEARICTLCNFVQLHRSNIVKHLHQQHNIKQILPIHIQTIVLLKASTIPASLAGSTSSISSSRGHGNRNCLDTVSSYDHDTYIIDDDDSDHGSEVILDDVEREDPNNSENHYYNYIPPYMQAAVNSGNFPFANVDAGDDLSFMICGMLDVQMNPE